MKKILFVGKINDSIKGVEELLGEHFRIQLCPINSDSVKDMQKVITPDLIMVSLLGAVDSDRVIFDLFEKGYPGIPVLTVGNEEEQKRFSGVYRDGVEHLMRPVDKKTTLETVCSKLNTSLLVSEGSFKVVENRSKKLIMVVDDNAMTLRSIKEMLQDSYDIAVATSGMKALTLMGKNLPDLILLDYEMPVCDGKMTLEMIKAEDEFKDVPVIFLTGVSDREHVEAVLSLRPAGYILKPPVREKLMEAIRKNLKE